MEASMLPIQRTSSIEREPRTLRIDQIQSARDLAIYILNTKSFEEASRIFTEGLQPVVSAACSMGSGGKGMNMDPDEEMEAVDFKYKGQEAPVAAFRDIASAPF